MGNEDGGGRTKRFTAYLAWRACSATLDDMRQ
jgi:hypothetical protein